MGSPAVLQNTATGWSCALEPDHIVGRAPPPATCLRIDKPYVSAVHAALRWLGETWVVRDLGSRNGTYLGSRRIAAGEGEPIRAGDRIGFGSVDETWVLVDDGPPPVMAVPVGGGDPVLIENDLLALPSAEDPRATVYRSEDGSWTLEPVDEPSRPLVNRDTFDVAGTLWRFCCPDRLATTLTVSDLAAAPGPTVRSIELRFDVSRNEEFVQIHATVGGDRLDLGSRAHNYLLLTLARRRLADMSAGLPETSCGWIEQEDLAHDPSMAPPRLNIDVHRIRRQFARAGVVDAQNIVERRVRPAQLRIGTGRLSVVLI
jgi:hypothetical protein